MKLYGLLVVSIVISGFLIIGCASSLSFENKDNVKSNAIAVSNTKEKLSKEDAVKLVKEYLKNEKSYIPNFIEVDNISGDVYIVHAYDVITNKEEVMLLLVGGLRLICIQEKL
ncbi:putative lipoprotein [[Clostridium] sordellii ATCC 9714]|nr:putative lipoprotein [[Clostridium] sordellii ATCC 9714] [Paeniclostridium sordellii ATCC 9714]